MKILCIDIPSKMNCGWAVLERNAPATSLISSGVKNVSGEWIGESLYSFELWLAEMLSTYEIDCIVIEQQMGFGHAALRAKLNAFVGIVQLFCYKNSLPLFMISPKQAKKMVTGNGNATKQQVIDRVLEIFRDDFPENYDLPEHCSDAIAMGLTAILTSKVA